MHKGNRQFLADLARRYPEHFTSCKVLELGSLNINGSCRFHFSEDCEYVGIDIVDGQCVDFVVAAKDTEFEPSYFDTLISFSMVEHDPDWRESLAHNFQWLRSGGLFAMCWGGEGNLRHAPDPWEPVLLKDMTEFLASQPLYDLDIFAERDRYAADCPGAFDAVGRKR